MAVPEMRNKNFGPINLEFRFQRNAPIHRPMEMVSIELTRGDREQNRATGRSSTFDVGVCVEERQMKNGKLQKWTRKRNVTVQRE